MLLAFALACGGCKKGESNESGGAAANPPAPAQPAVDCAKLLSKIEECGDAFWTPYNATEDGKRHPANFRENLAKPTMGPDMCKMVWGNKSDNRWLARYNACWETPDCAAWSPCMATALGTPLPVP